ncbi:MAG: hypothetical protein Hals2KO_18200 [Halioglobus sp.]
MQPPDDTGVTLFCDLSALTAAQRQRHRELALQLRPRVAMFIEIADGYRARFDGNVDESVAEFCELEQRCCPFFTLTLRRDGADSELEVTGPGDVKPFIRAEFGIVEADLQHD